jgi:hypothetical protein
VNTLPRKIYVEFTSELSPGHTMNGTITRRSDTGVAAPSIPTGSESSESVIVITAMCLALMDQTLSPDAMALAMYSAQDMAEKNGVSPARYEAIINRIGQTWLSRRGRNPLSGMF